MAITASQLTNGSGTGGSAFTTASVSYGGGLILVAVGNSSFGSAPGAPSVSGLGLTWVEVVHQDDPTSSPTSRITLFRSMGSSSSGTLTITPSTNNGTMWAIVEFSGTDTSGTNGSGAIVQSVGNRTDGGSPDSLTITLSALSDATNNAVYAAFATDGDTLQTPGTGYTELSDDDSLSGSNALSLETQWKLPGTTTPSASGQPDFADIYGVAVEIKAGTSGIAFDAAANSGYQAASSSYTFARTITGSNTFLAVDVGLLSAGQTVTSVIDNYDVTPVNLFFIGAQSTVSSVGRVEQWGLAGAVTGTKNVQVNLSGSIASAAVAASYTGVNQSRPTEAFNSAQATNVGAADATVDITTITDSCWVHGAIATNDGSITANQTSRNNVSGVGGSAANEDNNAAKTPAGAVTMSYTNVGALQTWAIAGYAIRPVTAVDTTLAPTIGAETYSGNAASVLLGLAPTSGAITFDGYGPLLSKQLLPTVGSVIFSGNIPSLISAFLLNPTEGAVSFSGAAPGISFLLVPSEGSTVFSGNAPDFGGRVLHYSRRHGRCYYS